MAINFDDALGIHQQALKVRVRRAAILANNLANTDTPHFKARDIDFKGILRGESLRLSASKTSLIETDHQHISGQALTSNNDLLYRVPNQPSIDGNTVEEQVEHAAYMSNALEFQSSFQFLNSKFKKLTSALRGE